MNLTPFGKSIPMMLALLGVSLSSRAQTPEAIVQKMETLYKNVTTYECTFTMKKTSMGVKGKLMTLNSVNRFKYKTPNLYYLELKLTGDGRTITQVSNSDGKVQYLAIVEQKIYQKTEAPKRTRTPIGLFRSMMPDLRVSDVKMKPATQINGKAVYVIEVTQKMPMPDQKDAKPTLLYIDKASNTLVKAVSSSPLKGTMELMLTNQSVNPNFPASAFAYKPAADAKDISKQPRPGLPSGGRIGGANAPTPNTPVPVPPKK